MVKISSVLLALIAGCGIAMALPQKESGDAVNYYMHLNTTDGKSICALVSDDLKFRVEEGLFTVTTSDARFTCEVCDVRDISYARQINSGVTEILSGTDGDQPLVAFRSDAIEVSCKGSSNTCGIFSIDGRLVMQREFSDYIRIDVSPWQSGIYIININNHHSLKITVK